MSLQSELEASELEAAQEEREKQLRSAAEQALRRLAKAQAKTEDLIDAVYRASKDAALVAAKPPRVPSPKKDRRKGEESALVHLTDLQYGKLTESYSMAVCEERVALFADKIESITAIQRADHPVPGCHVMLGGDMVEGRGNIFPGQVHEVEAYLYEQLFGCARMQREFIARMLSIFEWVEVWEESGNHGRLGKKGEDAPGDNVDRMTYKIAHEGLGTQPRLTWHEQTTWHQIVEIGNYRAMLCHGDEIKGFGGNVPAFGILRKSNAWASGVVGEHLDTYMGHFHQPMTLQQANGGRVFVTPSTESGSIYAQEFVAAIGTPGQRLHFVDPVVGKVTAEYLIWLD